MRLCFAGTRDLRGTILVADYSDANATHMTMFQPGSNSSASLCNKLCQRVHVVDITSFVRQSASDLVDEDCACKAASTN